VSIEESPVRSFGRTSPVLAYWLAHGVGFRVRCGSRTGVVDDVQLDFRGEYASTLVVRFGRLERHEVPASHFETVVPAAEVLVLPAEALPEARFAPTAERASAAGERAAASARRGAAASVGFAARWGRRGLRDVWAGIGMTTRWLAPRARTTAIAIAVAVTWLARHVVALARWTAPRIGAAAVWLGLAAVELGRGIAGKLAALVRAARAHGPPAVRAVRRRVSRALARLRATRVVVVQDRPPTEPDERPDEPSENEDPPEPGRARGHAA